MLKLINNKFFVESIDLRRDGIRSPQGFSFEFSNEDVGTNHFWTTDLFAAYLFYKRHRKASPEVEEFFAKTLAKQTELYDLSYSTTSNTELIAPEGFEYRPYQKASIEYCLKADNVLIGHDMRLGKTCISVGVINNYKPDKTLIICPKTAKLVWAKELETWLAEKKNIQILTAQSELDPDADIYVTNYDNLHKLSDLTRIEFGLLIADEVHLIKNENARRSKFFTSIQAKKKLGLSGTPLLNKPNDLLTILKWLDPFWANWRIYKEEFANSNGIVLSLAEVQDVIRSTVMTRLEQAQVFDMEPIERRIVPLEVPPELAPQIEIELNREKKQLKLSDYTNARRIIGLSRVQPAINHILTYTSEGEKIVCFAWSKAVVERITSSLGKRAVQIYGATTDKDRKANIERFYNDPDCQVIVGSIPAMSMAINLSVSNHILFVEQDWTPGLMEQAEERCSDKNQKKSVLVEYLVFHNSLDERMARNRATKESHSDEALNIVY